MEILSILIYKIDWKLAPLTVRWN